ncbi:MAG: hypothetical protein AAF191_16330 [Verrucomicrobiota bacterium]
MPAAHHEKPFETAITEHLLAHGWRQKTAPLLTGTGHFSRPSPLAFIEQTQPKAWGKLKALHGDNTGDIILQELCRMMEQFGCLTVLPHGFKCSGQQLKVAFFRPAHGLNSEAEALYQ